MNRDVVTISQDTPLRAAAELFFQRRIEEAAVVDADGRCVAILSATGLIRWTLGEPGGAKDVPPLEVLAALARCRADGACG
jgi:CBS domain-containing protein